MSAEKREERGMKINYFGTLHPVILFTYFAAVLLFSMFFMHPAFLLISLFGGFFWAVSLAPRAALRFSARFLLPMAAVMTAVNPLINHSGVTVLLYVNDQPMTGESLAYGAASAVMFSGVLLWFFCSNRVMTAEKFTALFGRVAPALSLLLSMVMRFVPRFEKQARIIAEAQKGIGRSADTGNLLTRAKNGMKILSILTTWALENGVTTADSMWARGYGLPGRSSFQTYRFDNRDKIIFIIQSVLIFAVFFGALRGENRVLYYPLFYVAPVSSFSMLIFFFYFLLCVYPLLINAFCEVKYHGNF